MNNKILIIYKSVTGFTKDYAVMIAEELDCEVISLKEASSKSLSEFDVIVFGGRFHAGKVDGLIEARKIFEQGTAKKFIVFATGATPNSIKDVIDNMWKNNFSPQELDEIPHFYMQSGLRYENMPFGDKFMMKVFSMMLKRKKDKDKYEKSFENAVSASHDISSREYIRPLVDYIMEVVL